MRPGSPKCESPCSLARRGAQMLQVNGAAASGRRAGCRGLPGVEAPRGISCARHEGKASILARRRGDMFHGRRGARGADDPLAGGVIVGHRVGGVTIDLVGNIHVADSVTWSGRSISSRDHHRDARRVSRAAHHLARRPARLPRLVGPQRTRSGLVARALTARTLRYARVVCACSPRRTAAAGCGRCCIDGSSATRTIAA